VKLPRWLWLPILYGVVLRTRPEKSAEKYSQIWMPEGSPLAVNTARQARLLEERTGLPVRYAMRYGEPRIGKVLNELEDPIVLPLYPQYSESTTASVGMCCRPVCRCSSTSTITRAYISALAANVRRHWSRHGRGGKVTSFHGLPKRGSERYEGMPRHGATPR
jgi:ferrochelatase